MKRVVALLVVILFLAGLVLGFGAGVFYPQPERTVSQNAVRMHLPAVRSDLL